MPCTVSRTVSPMADALHSRRMAGGRPLRSHRIACAAGERKRGDAATPAHACAHRARPLRRRLRHVESNGGNGSRPARARLAALRPPVALCLSGGGARGAAQAGVVIELIRSGLRPDFIVGTSIGAWNGAWLAAHPTLDGVEELA